MTNLPTKNNNPGDLKDPSTGQFQVFNTPQEGFGALLNDLQIKIKHHPDHTLADFANQYAPPSDNNNTAQYTANLANKLGVSPDTPIGSLQPQIGKFAEAVASNEGYPVSSNNPSQNTSPTNSSATSQPSTWDYITSLAGAGANEVIKNAKPLAATGITSGLIGLGTLGGAAIPGLGETGIGEAGGAVAGEVLANSINKGLGLTGGGSSNNPPVSTVSPQNNKPNVSLQDLTQADSNSKKLFDTYVQALGTTEGGTKMIQDPVTHAGINANSMFGLAPQIDINGRQDYSKALNKSQGLVGGLSGEIQDIISSEDSKGNFDEARKEAKNIVRERLSETEWKNADKEIDDAVNTYQTNSGASMKEPTAQIARFDKMRSETGAGKKWGLMDTTTKKEAYKAVSMAARKQVEKNTKNPQLYNATMKMEANLINGQKIMKRLNGKKAIKNQSVLKSVLKGLGNAAGAYIGEKIGGTLGGILGYLVENNVSKSVEKNFGRTVFETAQMKKALKKLQSKSPVAYQVLVAELEKDNPIIAKKVEEDTKNPPSSNPKQTQKPPKSKVEGIIPSKSSQSPKSTLME